MTNKGNHSAVYRVWLDTLYVDQVSGWAPVVAFPKSPKIEPPPAPLPMAPTADDPATIMAQRKRLLEKMGGGRLSAILSDDTGYSGDRLGVR